MAPSGVSPKITKPINSALRIVTHINPNAKKKAAKKLLRAAKLLQKAALKLAYDDSLSPEVRAGLNTAIYNLVNTINAGLNDLGAGAAS
jgi:hypothetical protein